MKGSADKERMVWVFLTAKDGWYELCVMEGFYSCRPTVLEQLEKGTRLARSRQDRPVKEG